MSCVDTEAPKRGLWSLRIITKQTQIKDSSVLLFPGWNLVQFCEHFPRSLSLIANVFLEAERPADQDSAAIKRLTNWQRCSLVVGACCGFYLHVKRDLSRGPCHCLLIRSNKYWALRRRWTSCWPDNICSGTQLLNILAVRTGQVFPAGAREHEKQIVPLVRAVELKWVTASFFS